MHHAQRCISDQTIKRTRNLASQTAIVVLREDQRGHKDKRKGAPYSVIFLHPPPPN
jgi:hypothetical protein